MSRAYPVSFSVCLMAAAVCGAAEDATKTPASELSPGVWGVLASPAEVESCPGVILLHGASGWRSELARLASDMADSGFVVLALDYYADAGPAARRKARIEKWPAYKEAVRRSVDYMESLPAVHDQPIGLVGFSRGAFLAVSVASSIPGVRAVVDFYGGGGAGTQSVKEEVRGLPPLLILHGEADEIVPVSFAKALEEAAVSSGGDVEMHIYPGAGHAFNAPYNSGYQREAAHDSYRRMMQFLARRLKPD
ncbi:MAG: dienelactone hydrolase family protein [bacterium]